MARIRSVHPELCTDETLAAVGANAERTFVRLWPHLDDEGRAVYNPKLIKAALYPLDDTVSAEDVARDIDELVQVGLLLRYEVDGKEYISAKPDSWARWQKPRWRYESKFPAPPSPDSGPRPTSVRPTSDVRRHKSSSREVGVEKEQQRSVRPASDANPSSEEPEEAAAASPKLVEEALNLIVDRRIANGNVGNPAGYRRTTVDKLKKDHAHKLASLDRNAKWTAQSLADWLAPPTKPKPPDPEERTAQAREVMYAQSDAEPCAECGHRGGHGWVELDGVMHPCPTCHPLARAS